MSHQFSEVPPSEADLRAVLGRSFAAYGKFLRDNQDLRPEWKYYGAKAGWTLKLFEKRRNLCFVSPHEGEFMIAFLLGARAVELALDSDLPEAIKSAIRVARTYVEGRPVRLTVKKLSDLAPAATLLGIKHRS